MTQTLELADTPSRSEPLPTPATVHIVPASPPRPARLVSLDAYRGLIMLALISSGFGLGAMAKQKGLPETSFWEAARFHTSHPEWLTGFDVKLGGLTLPLAVSLWDLIMPAFVFMAGVSMPYSFGRRLGEGQSRGWALTHVLIRSVVLVLLGVLLQSRTSAEANWIFTNVLSQIGLGYTIAYLYLGKPRKWQIAGCAVLFAGYIGWFWLYPNHAAGGFGPWTKDANVGAAFDGWFLGLFPSYKANTGGYTTLNFVPTIATMIFGVMCGETLRKEGRSAGAKLLWLIAGGAACLALGAGLSMLTWNGVAVCPNVKRLWTPSFALVSGAYVIWILAAFYLVCDVAGLRRWAFPLVVVGMNSILAYLMEQTIRGWTGEMLRKFFGAETFGGLYGPMVLALSVTAVFWLVLYWLYRQRAFIRI